MHAKTEIPGPQSPTRPGKLRVKKLRVASCELRVASCELRVASCKLRVASCKLQVASCKLRVASCELAFLYAFPVFRRFRVFFLLSWFSSPLELSGGSPKLPGCLETSDLRP